MGRKNVSGAVHKTHTQSTPVAEVAWFPAETLSGIPADSIQLRTSFIYRLPSRENTPKLKERLMTEPRHPFGLWRSLILLQNACSISDNTYLTRKMSASFVL